MLEKTNKLIGKVTLYCRYICAPLGSGKTASVLPMFLASTKLKQGGFTHYLYLPFSNNSDRHFELNESSGVISEDSWTAYDQGAAFMSECVKALVLNPKSGITAINLESNPDSSIHRVGEKIGQFLNETLGADSKCLIHIDDIRKVRDNS